MLQRQIHRLIGNLRSRRLRCSQPVRIAIVVLAGASTVVGPFGCRRDAFAEGPCVVAGEVFFSIDRAENLGGSSSSPFLDDLVKRGDFASALRACDAMARNSQGMAKGVALRHAVLKLFAPESETELDAVLDLLNTACAAGSRLEGRELGGGTLRSYLESTPIAFDESLNQFSRLALENTELAVGNLLLISALLRLDGQETRSRLFATEAYDRASETGELKWNSLMVVLHRS